MIIRTQFHALGQRFIDAEQPRFVAFLICDYLILLKLVVRYNLCFPSAFAFISFSVTSDKGLFCRRRASQNTITSDPGGFAGVRPPRNAAYSGQHSLTGIGVAGAKPFSDERTPQRSCKLFPKKSPMRNSQQGFGNSFIFFLTRLLVGQSDHYFIPAAPFCLIQSVICSFERFFQGFIISVMRYTR